MSGVSPSPIHTPPDTTHKRIFPALNDIITYSPPSLDLIEEDPLCFHQLFKRSLLNDLAIVEVEDVSDAPKIFEVVGDRDGCCVL